jgi:hypothetical protein
VLRTVGGYSRVNEACEVATSGAQCVMSFWDLRLLLDSMHVAVYPECVSAMPVCCNVSCLACQFLRSDVRRLSGALQNGVAYTARLPEVTHLSCLTRGSQRV